MDEDVIKIILSKLKTSNATLTLGEALRLVEGRASCNPVTGYGITLKGERYYEHDVLNTEHVRIHHLWHGLEDTSIMNANVEIYIGHEFSGPMLSLQYKEPQGWLWYNLYSNDDYGADYAVSGTFRYDSLTEEGFLIPYSTASECLRNRNYIVNGKLHDKSYTESERLINEVFEFIKQFEERR